MSIISHNIDKLSFTVDADNRVVGLIVSVAYESLYGEFSGASHPDYPGFRLSNKKSSVVIWDELSSAEKASVQKVFDGVNTSLAASDYSIIDDDSGVVVG